MRILSSGQIYEDEKDVISDNFLTRFRSRLKATKNYERVFHVSDSLSVVSFLTRKEQLFLLNCFTLILPRSTSTSCHIVLQDFFAF